MSESTSTNAETKPTTRPQGTLHDCPYCQNKCYGKQCRDCHLAMQSEREADCRDCLKPFPAKRPDGSFRQRCRDCQSIFNLNMHKCSTCEKSFYALPKEGVVYENCFDCHKAKNFKKCDNESCEKQTRVSHPFCQECYSNERSKPRVLTKVEENDCASCGAKTSRRFCFDCSKSYRDHKDLEDAYVISTCQHAECNYRGRGSFKFCEEHRTKK
jgi:hypothetical protein